MTHKYIYGIIAEAEPKTFDVSGIEDAPVYTINHLELAAAVSDTALESIDPTRRNVMVHTVVQDRLLKGYTILPAGFGIISGGEAEVIALLEINRLSLLGELQRLSGKVEFNVRAVWDRSAVLEELERGNGELARIKARLSAASPRDAEPLLREAGRLVERIVCAWRDRYARQVYRRLQGLAADARAGEPAGVTGLLNASFLIERSRGACFQEELRRLDVEFPGKINFKCVGPLPPYTFVNTGLVRRDAVRTGL